MAERVCEHCGHVSRDAEPTDAVFELQRATERIAELEAEIRRLKRPRRGAPSDEENNS